MMPVGPGKYDDLCTYVREQAVARAAIVIIIDGNKGHGFSVQSDLPIEGIIELLEQATVELKNSVRTSSAQSRYEMDRSEGMP